MIEIKILQKIFFDSDYCYYWRKICVTPYELKKLIDECNTIKI